MENELPSPFPFFVLAGLRNILDIRYAFVLEF